MCECSGGFSRLVSSRSFLLQFESHWVCRSEDAHKAVGEWIPSEVGRVKGRENTLEVDCIVSVVRRAKVKGGRGSFATRCKRHRNVKGCGGAFTLAEERDATCEKSCEFRERT